MGKGKEAARIIAGGMMATIALMCAAGCYLMLRDSLTPRWIPVCIALLVTVPLALPLRGVWKWITGSDNVALNMASHVLFIFPLLLCSALVVNYACGSPTGSIDACVEKVYRQTRYRSKRVGRRTYTRGQPYQVYCLEVRTDNGTTRDLDISRKIYNQVCKGDTIHLDVLTGPLGIRMLDTSHPHLPEKIMTRQKETRREKMRRRYREHMEKVLNRRYENDRDSD